MWRLDAMLATQSVVALPFLTNCTSQSHYKLCLNDFLCAWLLATTRLLGIEKRYRNYICTDGQSFAVCRRVIPLACDRSAA